VLIAMALISIAVCRPAGPAGTTPKAPRTVRLTSPAFGEGQPIPRPYTCDGEDRIPPLAWEGLNPYAREVALVVEDPGAPRRPFVHWVVWGLPPFARLDGGRLPEGTRQGRNGYGRRAWDGPCPPRGDPPHKYVFTLFVLGRPLDLESGASAADLKRALIRAWLLETGHLTGVYRRRP
jgi:Raf kinase inhibitor-like YbhB/YbcL family protein